MVVGGATKGFIVVIIISLVYITVHDDVCRLALISMDCSGLCISWRAPRSNNRGEMSIKVA